MLRNDFTATACCRRRPVVWEELRAREPDGILVSPRCRALHPIRHTGGPSPTVSTLTDSILPRRIRPWASGWATQTRALASGRSQDHLTMIDVPGIFRVPTPGLTRDNDILLVENIVKPYIGNSRTIILAVIPCNVDVATQEILTLAETADPTGLRTMGVLTKPDLAAEMATRNAVIDLVRGKGSSLNLGYYVVKNRGAVETDTGLLSVIKNVVPPRAQRRGVETMIRRTEAAGLATERGPNSMDASSAPP